MLTLINGDGNPRVTAAQDADWYGSLTGEKTCIMPANDKFSATVADANTIEVSSGVLITKEGRRVQIDAETIEEIIIPTGTQGSDTYYIIGFHLYIDESGQQVAETFVETMENESDTITETTFREGSTSIYISLYRVKRSGLTLESVTRICPMYELSADEIVYGNTDVGAELTQINRGLSAINSDLSALSEDIKLLATLDGATATSTWVNVDTADSVKINSFRSFIVSLVKSDGTVMRNEFIPFAQMGIARYNENMISCSMSVVNGLTSGTVYGLCAVYSNTAFSLWINHANYSLKVYGCK